MFTSRKPLRMGALALAMASGTATAGQLDYTLYAGIEHSDNVNLSASQPISQNILVPGLNFSYLQQGSAIQANVAGSVEYRDYLGGAFDNQTFTQLAGRVNWTVLPQRLDFTVQDFAAVQPLSTLSSNAPNNQQQTNVLTLGPTLYFRPGNTLHGQVELRYINSDASKTKAFNSSRGEGALRLFKDLNTTDQLSVNVESQRVDFSNTTSGSSQSTTSVASPNYHHDSIFGRYTSKLAQVDLDVVLGWSRIDFRSAPSVSSSLMRFTLDWHPSVRSTFSLMAARQYSDATTSLMSPATQPLAGLNAGTAPAPGSPGGIVVGGSVINPQVYLARTVEGTYTFIADRLSFTLSPYYNHLTYLNDPTFNQDSRGVSGGLDYRLNSTLTLRALVDAQHLNYSNLQRRDRVSDYSIGLTERRTPHWSYQLMFTHRQRSSTTPGQGYQENRIYLGVIYQR